jgi:hypothetical protein
MRWLPFCRALVILLLSFACGAVRAAPFVNLNFEQATVPPGNQTTLPAGLAFPGWIARLDETVLSSVRYNDIGVGQASVTLYDMPNPSNTGIPVFEGKYGAILTGSVSGTVSASLAQVGDVPIDTRSIRLLAEGFRGPPALTVNSQVIPLLRLSSGGLGQPALFGGEIDSFAGATVEVRFTGVQEIFALDADFVLATKQYRSRPAL